MNLPFSLSFRADFKPDYLLPSFDPGNLWANFWDLKSGSRSRSFWTHLNCTRLIGTGFDINIGAIFLILLGIGLLIIEIKVPGFGIFGFAGLISLIIGSILLVPMGSENIYTPEFRKVLTLTVVAPTVVFGLFLVFAIYKVTEIRKKKTGYWRVYRRNCRNHRSFRASKDRFCPL
ncbi:hypothetical protein [Methanosarcina barkeri]|uniref:hypothetical protein n=1 Tax=Methanosarcina barkeri TaxID=2208 RepID=UPI000A7497AE|nr:hypothetical protein [Methanosarcina barkeri]